MRIIWIAALCCATVWQPLDGFAQDVIISVAGKTTEGYTGDSGRAVNCLLHWPESVALDKIGNLYIADADNNVIRKISAANGMITTVVGSGFEAGTGTGGYSGDGGAATAAKLFYPSGVAFDTSGNMYIADCYNHRVRMVNTSGVISTFAGNGSRGYTGDGAAAGSAQLDSPARVATDRFGNVYIADQGNNAIRQVNSALVINTFAGTGTAGFAGDGGAANAALLSSPRDMAADTAGVVYIADYANSRIRKVDLTGTISTYAGILYPGYSGDGGAATAANIFEPSGIVADDSGNIFFSDFANQRIRAVSAAGIITSLAGNGSPGYSGDGGVAPAAEIYFPQGLAVDRNHGIFFADKANNRIRYLSKTLAVPQVSPEVQDVTIWPDPSSGAFEVLAHSVADQDVWLSLANITGQTVARFHGRTNTPISVDVQIPAGVYFAEIRTGYGVVNRKFVVR